MTLPRSLSGVKARHDRLVSPVETMLKLHKDLPKAKTPHEQESIQEIGSAKGSHQQCFVKLDDRLGGNLPVVKRIWDSRRRDLSGSQLRVAAFEVGSQRRNAQCWNHLIS